MKNVLWRAVNHLREKGTLSLLKTGLERFTRDAAVAWYYRSFRQRSFEFEGQEYDCFYHRFNRTWNRARAVEIPLTWREVQECDGEILEVGNVLPYYFDTSHDVLDKYEKGENVINEDAADFSPRKNYELIVSISTLEHIGYDYHEEKQPEKIENAVENLKSLLVEGGRIFATIPLGYNPQMDRLLEKDELGFDKKYMKRVSRDNRWEQVPREEAEGSEYGDPYPLANAVVIAEYRNS